MSNTDDEDSDDHFLDDEYKENVVFKDKTGAAEGQRASTCAIEKKQRFAFSGTWRQIAICHQVFVRENEQLNFFVYFLII